MRRRIPMDLQIQYVRIRANVAPARLWESLVRPARETPAFFRVAGPGSVRSGALVTWQSNGRSPPCTGRGVGCEEGCRLVIVLEPDDELHMLGQIDLHSSPGADR